MPGPGLERKGKTWDEGIVLGVEGTVSGSTVRNNEGSGVVAYGGAHVSGNTILGNRLDGISVATGSLVRSNVVQRNGQNGTAAIFGSSVLDNTVYDNGGIRSGFGLDLSVQVTYRGNTLQSNTSGGVSSGVNLGDNFCEGPNVTSAACP